MSVLRYRGYLARVEYDVDDRILTGRIAGINDVIGFHGKTGDDLEIAFHEAVDDYIETCRRADKAPERPFGGKVMFRVKPDVHARAALAAQLRGVSLNQWAEEALDQKADADLVNCR